MITITVVIASLFVLAIIAISPRTNPELYRKMLFSPDPYSERDYNRSPVAGVEPEDVYITTKSGAIIHGWFYRKPGASHAVLFSHGNAGNVGSWKYMAEYALRNDMAAFVYDYRGYGLSNKIPTLWGICEDGLAAFDWLTEAQGFSPENITLFGISMGTGVTCQIAKQRKHAGLILESGFSNFRRLTNEIVPLTRYVPMVLYFRQPLNNMAVLKDLTTAKLIIHGAQDELIVVGHSEELFNVAHEPKQLIVFPLGKHRGLGSMEAQRQYGKAIDTFLQNVRPAV